MLNEWLYVPLLERLELVERLRDSIAVNPSDPPIIAEDKALIDDAEVVLNDLERCL
jgi:hypothetical protein